MTRVLFAGRHGALVAALGGGAFTVPSPGRGRGGDRGARRPFPQRVVSAERGDVVLDTDEWNLPAPAGLCLEEVCELRAVIEQRVSSLPL